MIRTKSSVYPMEYNKNDPMEGYNEWAQYIHSEVLKLECNSQPVLRHYDHIRVDDIREMYRLRDQAKKIINK